MMSEECVVEDLCEGSCFHAVFAESKLCEVREAGVIVAIFEG